MKSHRPSKCKVDQQIFCCLTGGVTVLLSVCRKCYKIDTFCNLNYIYKELLGLLKPVIRGSKLFNIWRSSFFVPTFATLSQPVRACPARADQ